MADGWPHLYVANLAVIPGDVGASICAACGDAGPGDLSICLILRFGGH